MKNWLSGKSNSWSENIATIKSILCNNWTPEANANEYLLAKLSNYWRKKRTASFSLVQLSSKCKKLTRVSQNQNISAPEHYSAVQLRVRIFTKPGGCYWHWKQDTPRLDVNFSTSSRIGKMKIHDLRKCVERLFVIERFGNKQN